MTHGLRRAARRGWLALPGLFLGTWAVFAACSCRCIDIYDEGIILTGADRVLHGAWPHRDFYADYGVAQFAIVAGLFKMSGAYVVVERAWDSCVRAMIVLLSFKLARQVAPPGTALAVALATMAWLASFWFGYGYPLFPVLAALMAALVCLVRGDPGWRPFAAGVCIGVATLFRYDIGVVALVAMFFGVAACAMLLRLQRISRPLLLLLGGWGCASVPGLILFWANGVLPDLIFDAFSFPARFYVATRSLPFPGLASVLRDRLMLGVYFPFFALAAGVPVVLRAVVLRVRGTAWPAAERIAAVQIVLLGVFVAVGLAKGYVRASPMHMAMAFVFALPLVARLVSAPGCGRRARLAGLAVAGVAAVVTWASLDAAGRRAAQNVAWAARSWGASGPAEPAAGPCHMPPALAQLSCFPVPAAEAQTIAYVHRHTAPTDRVFVGMSHHDRIFAGDEAMYFFVDRTPATKWYHFNPGLQNSAAIQQDMVDGMRRAPPAYVILYSGFDGVAEPNGSAVSSGVMILDDYLGHAFTQVAAFGDYRILAERVSD